MSTFSPSEPRQWNEPLAETRYLRARLAPGIWSDDHAVLLDLAAAIRQFAARASGRLFDYGCGGTPYREFFSGCSEYIGADIVDGPRVDRLLDASGLTAEPDGAYDTVFSSQVLEHVAAPDQYLAEAFRILAPGGLLILTTHGMYQEHGCPHDYYRWTPSGLEHAVSKAGFKIEETVKITPGTRASIRLMHLAIETACPRHSFVARLLMAGVRRIWRWIFRPIANVLAGFFEPRPFIAGDAPEPVYICIGIVARK